MRPAWLAGLLLATAAGSAAASQPLPELLECIRGQVPTGPQTYRLEMISRDRGGGESRLLLNAAVAAKAGNGSLRLEATSPPDVAGTTYLLRRREDRQQIFVYLPSQDSARPLAPGQDIRLFGSDLPASMLLDLALSLDQNAVSSTGSETVAGETLRKLYVTQPPAKSTGHMLKVLVAPQSCTIRRMTLLSGNRPELELQADPGIFRRGEQAGQEVVIDNPRQGTRTTLRILEARHPEELPARLFHPHRFYQ